jgi:hypothetical protein
MESPASRSSGLELDGPSSVIGGAPFFIVAGRFYCLHFPRPTPTNRPGREPDDRCTRSGGLARARRPPILWWPVSGEKGPNWAAGLSLGHPQLGAPFLASRALDHATVIRGGLLWVPGGESVSWGSVIVATFLRRGGEMSPCSRCVRSQITCQAGCRSMPQPAPPAPPRSWAREGRTNKVGFRPGGRVERLGRASAVGPGAKYARHGA